MPSLLDRITAHTEESPDRIVIVGRQKVGKTTFAASAPRPIIITAEDGLRGPLLDTPHITPTTWQDALAIVAALSADPHPYETVVIDSIDWLLPMLRLHLIEIGREKADTFDTFGGRGWVHGIGEVRRLLSLLDDVRRQRGAQIIILAHAAVTRQESAFGGGNVERWDMPIDRRLRDLIVQWADSYLYACTEEVVHEANGKTRATPTGRRLLRTVEGPTWMAGNRYGLPPEIDLVLPDPWAAYERARGAIRNGAQSLRSEADELLGRLSDHEKIATMRDAVAKAVTTAQLSPIVSRMRQLAAGVN